jgi:hypothetical protein
MLHEQVGIQGATGASRIALQAFEHYFSGLLKEVAPCTESVAHEHG